MTKAFGTVLRDLLIERGNVTAMGNPNWAAFAMELPTINYETLRKAVTGERSVSERVMEEVASALGVEPDVFPEYQLAQASKAFDPREVGNEEALRNLELWVAAKASAKKQRGGKTTTARAGAMRRARPAS